MSDHLRVSGSQPGKKHQQQQQKKRKIEIEEEEQDFDDIGSINSEELENVRAVSDGDVPTKDQLRKMKLYAQVWEVEGKHGDLVEFIFKKGKPPVQKNLFNNKNTIQSGLELLGFVVPKKESPKEEKREENGMPKKKQKK